VDAGILRLTLLDDLAMNLDCVDTIRAPDGLVGKRQIAEAIVSAVADGLLRRCCGAPAPISAARSRDPNADSG
jgi:hypothetical protein